jgi:hypothetical protein
MIKYHNSLGITFANYLSCKSNILKITTPSLIMSKNFYLIKFINKKICIFKNLKREGLFIETIKDKC